MKKIIALLLTVLLAVCTAVPAFAASTDYTVYAAQVSATAGETAQIPVLISGNKGIIGFWLDFSYDPSMLTIESVAAGSALAGNGTVQVNTTQAGKAGVLWSGNRNCVSDGELLVLNCRIGSNAIGSTSIDISVASGDDTFIDDGNDSNVTLNTRPINVTIANPALASTPIISGSQIRINDGVSKSFSVKVQNPANMTAFALNLEYDAGLMTISNVTSSLGGTFSAVETGAGRLRVTYSGSAVTADTVLFSAKLTTAKYAEGSSAIKISYDRSKTAFDNSGSITADCRNISVEITNTHAAEPIIIYADDATVTSQVFTVPVKIKNNNGLWGMEALKLSYPSDVIEYTGKWYAGDVLENASVAVKQSRSSLLIDLFGASESTADGTLISIEFRALNLTEMSVATIELSAFGDFDAFDGMFQTVDADFENAELYILVDYEFGIVTQPKALNKMIGEVAYFTVETVGYGLTYQWQCSTDDGATWHNNGFSTAKSSTLEVTVTEVRDGYRYRCVVTGANGQKKTSNAAKLTVGVGITSQPVNVTKFIGDTAYFAVKATGVTSLSYQWQSSTDGGKTWNNNGFSTAKTATLEVLVTAARDGYQYRCVVTGANGQKMTSNAAALTTGVKITSQPADSVKPIGDTAYFTVKATGVTSLSYQWQSSADGGSTWNNNGFSTAKTASLEVYVKEARNGYIYRCVVTGANGQTAISNAAKLNVGVNITSQPVDSVKTIGDTANFTVKATGVTALKYQWQSSADGGATWNNNGFSTAKTATLEVYVTEARNGYMYRCVVTGANGRKTMSSAAKLTVS